MVASYQSEVVTTRNNVLRVLTEHEVIVETILWAGVQLGTLSKDNLEASYYLGLEPRKNKRVYLYDM